MNCALLAFSFFVLFVAPKSAPQNVELKMMKRSMEVVWTRLDENDWNGRNREYVITYSHNNQNLRKIVNYTVTVMWKRGEL